MPSIHVRSPRLRTICPFNDVRSDLLALRTDMDNAYPADELKPLSCTGLSMHTLGRPGNGLIYVF
jgi:hypothetical protein